MQNAKYDGVSFEVVVIDQKVRWDARHTGTRSKRRPWRAASRELNEASQSHIEAVAVLNGNARTGFPLEVR